MNRSIWLWVLGVAVVLGIVGGNWYWRNRPPAEPPTLARPAPVPVPQSPAPPPEPAIAHPVERIDAAPAVDARPLPPLAESDGVITDALVALLTQPRVQQFLNVQDVVRRIVVTIDNLPREKLPQQLSPVKRTAGAFQVTGKEGGLAIAPGNAARYRPMVAVLESLDTQKLVSAYVRLYPLFQQMYEELGYPGRYFNDRLVASLDHVIAAPEPVGPVPLVQPKVFYLYADPELEASSAGRKLLMRMGEDNARRVKAKLTEIRNAIAGPRAR